MINTIRGHELVDMVMIELEAYGESDPFIVPAYGEDRSIFLRRDVTPIQGRSFHSVHVAYHLTGEPTGKDGRYITLATARAVVEWIREVRAYRLIHE